MKKAIVLLVLCCLTFSLCGCADMGKTQEYRKAKKVYNSFVDDKQYTKQDIYKKLGQPQYPDLGYEDATLGINIDEMLFSSVTKQWSYYFYKLPDPADPYKLDVEFDDDGKVINMEFEPVHGG